jgi:hypothetical protein
MNDKYKEVLLFIKNNTLFVKKTNNIYNKDYTFNKNLIRTEHFYSEDKKIYTWQKKYNNYLYIYGNPFPKYSF